MNCLPDSLCQKSMLICVISDINQVAYLKKILIKYTVGTVYFLVIISGQFWAYRFGRVFNITAWVFIKDYVSPAS